MRALPAGGRAKWVVLALWLAAAGGLGQLQADLQEATSNDPAGFLPSSAESTQVLETLRTRFESGRTSAALVVHRRDDGLTEEDLAAIRRHLADLGRTLPPGARAPTPLLVSDDGTTAISTVLVEAEDIDTIEPAVERIRATLDESRPSGLGVWVTGPAGITVDAVEVFGRIDVVLLGATAALVLALLLVIYRSPVVAFVPLAVVALGVDYNIFLVARAREDARLLGARRGMIEALERTGGVITSAGIILAGTFLVLMLLPLEQLFQLGFAVALGVLVDTFVVRTLLVPSVALLLGPRSWWPARISP